MSLETGNVVKESTETRNNRLLQEKDTFLKEQLNYDETEPRFREIQERIGEIDKLLVDSKTETE